MATHIDRNHIHNHFVINSVNFETGYKWRQNPKELQEVKDYSDKICRKNGIIIIPKVNIGNYIKNGEYRIKAANRVMESITRFIEGTLKLTVNKEKSTVDRPWKLKFSGYSFYTVKGGVEFRVHEKSIKKLKEKIKYLTGRSRIGNIKTTYIKLKQVIVGWINYFKLAKMKNKMHKLDEWLRRRIRRTIIELINYLLLDYLQIMVKLK